MYTQMQPRAMRNDRAHLLHHAIIPAVLLSVEARGRTMTKKALS